MSRSSFYALLDDVQVSELASRNVQSQNSPNGKPSRLVSAPLSLTLKMCVWGNKHHSACFSVAVQLVIPDKMGPYQEHVRNRAEHVRKRAQEKQGCNFRSNALR